MINNYRDLNWFHKQESTEISFERTSGLIRNSKLHLLALTENIICSEMNVDRDEEDNKDQKYCKTYLTLISKSLCWETNHRAVLYKEDEAWDDFKDYKATKEQNICYGRKYQKVCYKDNEYESNQKIRQTVYRRGSKGSNYKILLIESKSLFHNLWCLFICRNFPQQERNCQYQCNPKEE